MDIQTISSEDYISNKWSGGTTTQLIIYPENSSLSERNFLWRISSASFTSTSSKFSDFVGYQRYLLALQGNLSVEHEGLYKRDLKPYEVEYFLGSWNTNSTNSEDCIDFNLIVRQGIQSNLVVLSEQDEYIPKRNGKIYMFSKENFQIGLYTESIDIFNCLPNNLTVIEEKQCLNRICIKMATSPVIICEIIL